MITKDLVKKYFSEGEDTNYLYDEKTDNVISKDTGIAVCSLNELTKALKEDYGESFENIYSEEATCSWVIRCTKCGCVLFGADDERYEPNLKCPCCTEYTPEHTRYWSAEEIEMDASCKFTIQFYENLQRASEEHDKRCKKRNNKLDWEILKKTIKFKNKVIYLALECDDITVSYFRGLRIMISSSKHVEKDGKSIWKWNGLKYIPLTINGIYSKISYYTKGKH